MNDDNAQLKEDLALDDEQQKYIAALPAKTTATQRWVTKLIFPLLNFESKRTTRILMQHRDAIRKERARIDALEAEAAQRAYCGAWQEGKTYRRHNTVTRNGNLFICLVDETRQQPADGRDWQLCVRAGRDAPR